jgi:predicted nucleic acid-binding protein
LPALKPVIVDTNILFSALLSSESQFAQVILGSDRSFFICESTIVELFKHKEKIVRLSKLPETDIIRLFYTLLRHMTVFKEVLIEPSIRQKAYQLCADIDEANTPYVALAMHLGGLLWTGDKTLQVGLRQRGFDGFFEPKQ